MWYQASLFFCFGLENFSKLGSQKPLRSCSSKSYNSFCSHFEFNFRLQPASRV